MLVTTVSLWGIAQSAWLAGAISSLEVGGVLWIAELAGTNITISTIDWPSLMPQSSDLQVIFAGAVLSFYAYIGFEDMVEVAEEVRDVQRTLPRAILMTLGTTSILYVLLMASRVLYGLASRKALPAVLASVSQRTHTPFVATLGVGAAVLGLALVGSIGGLAKGTSLIMLTVFALANLALFIIKAREDKEIGVADLRFRVPIVIPLRGAIVCMLFVLRSLPEDF